MVFLHFALLIYLSIAKIISILWNIIDTSRVWNGTQALQMSRDILAAISPQDGRFITFRSRSLFVGLEYTFGKRIRGAIYMYMYIYIYISSFHQSRLWHPLLHSAERSCSVVNHPAPPSLVRQPAETLNDTYGTAYKVTCHRIEHKPVLYSTRL